MSNLYDSITEKIIQLIEESRTLPWQKPWNIAFPSNAVTGRRYRGINALILSAANFADQRWLTFRQAQELGGHVRKGEKATQITLWKFNDEKADDEKQKRIAPLVRAYSVFNVEQCEGLGLAPIDVKEISPEPLAAADDLLARYVSAPRVVHGADNACYIPARDRVEMPSAQTFVSGESYFGTFAHELIHSTGSADRLARKGVTEPIYFGSENYAHEELVAEIGSAFVCAEFGIDNTIESNAAYVDNWLDALKRDRSLIIRAAGQAQKASDWILGTGTVSFLKQSHDLSQGPDMS